MSLAGLNSPPTWLDKEYILQLLQGGVPLPQRPAWNILGGASCTDDPVNNVTNIQFDGAAGFSQGSQPLASGILNHDVATNGVQTLRLSGMTAPTSLGGLKPAPGSSWQPGQKIEIINTSAFSLTLVHEDSGSTSTNRFDTLSSPVGSPGVPIVLAPRRGTAEFTYDGTSGRLVLTGTGYTYARFYDVRDFGAFGLAQFFNASNGRWYQDAAFTVEALDDAPGFQNAVDACIAAGGGLVYVPSLPNGGTWYFKVPQGSGNEFVRFTGGNVTVRGDGPSSLITIAPGQNTGSTPRGYAAVFGNSDGLLTLGAGSPINNCRFADIRVDKQAAYNQWGGANYNSQGARVCANATICLPVSLGCEVDHCTIQNGNGIFEVVTGTYGGNGSVYQVTNFAIHDNRFEEVGDDPNLGDSSIIAVGGNAGYLSDNRFTNSVFRPFPTAMETHGNGFHVTGNIVNNMHRVLNLAGDSLDESQIIVHGNIGWQVDTGITIFTIDGHKCSNLHITNNQFGLIKSTVYIPSGSGGTYAGVDLVFGDGSVTPYGTGLFDSKIEGNEVIWIDTVNAVPNNVYGINIPCGLVGRLKIIRNDIAGMGASGIALNIGFSANHSPPNRWTDTVVQHNNIYNSGTYGVSVSGGSGDSAVQFMRLTVTDNIIVDDRGGSSVLSAGVVVTAYTDSSCVVVDNQVTGFSNGAEVFDPTVGPYPNQSQFYPVRKASAVVTIQSNLQTQTAPSLQATNPTAATSGVPSQFAPAVYYSSFYWNGSASVQSESQIFMAPGPDPAIFFQGRTGGSGSYTTWMIGSLAGVELAASILGWEATVTAPELQYAQPQTNVATQALAIVSQQPATGATGTNGIAGALQLLLPASIGGAGGTGKIELIDETVASTPQWTWSLYSGGGGYSGWYAGGIDPIAHPTWSAIMANSTTTFIGAQTTINIGPQLTAVISVIANALGVFGQTPAGQQTGGVATAGGTYTATEQGMLQKVYNALRTFGFLS